MSETKEDLGVSIKKCTEFIASVHAETQMLLIDISGVLERHKFLSIKGSGIVVSDSSTKNIDNPAGWCHKAVARLFGEGGRKGRSKKLLAVEAHFAPSFGIDQAMLVIGYARFDEPQDKESLVAAYEESEWMAAAYGDDTPKLDEVCPRSKDDRRKIVPAASDVKVIGWALVSLDSSEVAQKKAAEALRKLGAV
jgi:hypothetical protein